jgi:hypothetical protein
VKRKGFGYVEKGRAHLAQVRSGSAELARQQHEHDAEAARISTQVRRTDERPLSRAERLGCPPGRDLDAWEAELKERAIANPDSYEMTASKKCAAIVASKYGLTSEVERIYALMLRTANLIQPRPTTVAVMDPQANQRVYFSIQAMPANMLAGFAPLNIAAIDPYQALELSPPKPPTMTFPLTQVPAPLSAQQRLDASRLIQNAVDVLEQADLIRWMQRPSFALIRL